MGIARQKFARRQAARGWGGLDGIVDAVPKIGSNVVLAESLDPTMGQRCSIAIVRHETNFDKMIEPCSPSVVAVIVICKNALETLPRALASIVAQNPGQILVAWTPAGAADETPKVVHQIAPKAKIIRVDAPGIAAARNAAIQDLGHCEVVAWCDADDCWLPGKLDAQLKCLAQGASWVVTSCEKSEEIITGFTPSTCAVSVTFLRRVGAWDARFHLAADHDWMVRARRLEEPVVLEEVYVHKGVHGANASNDRLAYRKELMRWARLQNHSKP